MSMRNYAVEEHGFIFSDDMLDVVAKNIFGTDAPDYNDREAAAEELDLNHISSFTGEAIRVLDDGSDDYSESENYNEDEIRYATFYKYSTLFKASYTSMDELVFELSERFGEYFPPDFNWMSHIKHIVGTYYFG